MNDITYIMFNNLDDLVQILFQIEMFEEMGLVVRDYDVIVTNDMIAIKTYGYGRKESTVYN